MVLRNPFNPVAEEKSSNFFVAENDRTKAFMKYVLEGVDEKRPWTSIIGDYGQGKSRMLFYILNKDENRRDVAFAFVSIKHVAGNISGQDINKELFAAILNHLIDDLIIRYKDRNPEIIDAIKSIKVDLVSDEQIRKLQEVAREKRESGNISHAEAVEEAIAKQIQRKIIDVETFFKTFLPGLVGRLRGIGVDRIFLLFDEMDYLSYPERKSVLKSFVSKFRDPIDGVSIVICCASRVWSEMRRDFVEFTQVYDPIEQGINIIPRYGYKDLEQIVKRNLSSINQENQNPFKETTLLVISRYYSNLRDMIKILEDLYHEFIKNQDVDISRIFRSRLESIINTPKIKGLAEDTQNRFFNDELGRNYRAQLESILQSLALDSRYYEADETEIKKLIGSVLGSAKHVTEVFSFWSGNGYLVRSDDGWSLNVDKFTRQTYVQEWEAEFQKRLWRVKDPDTMEVSIKEANEEFLALSKEYDLPEDYFETLIEVLIEERRIEKRPQSIKILYSEGDNLKDQIERIIKKNKQLEPEKQLISIILKEIVGIGELNSNINGFVFRHSVLGRGSTFQLPGTIMFLLPQRGAKKEKIKELLEKSCSSHSFVYLLWPYEDYGALKSFVEEKQFEDVKDVQDVKVKELELIHSSLPKGLHEKVRALVFFMGHKISMIKKVSMESYLSSRSTIRSDLPDAKEYLEKIDNEIKGGFTNSKLLAEPEEIMLKDLDIRIPINNKELKNLDHDKTLIILNKMFNGERVTTSDFEAKTLKQLETTYNFLTIGSDATGEKDLAMKPEIIEDFGGKKVPSIVPQTIRCIPNDVFIEESDLLLCIMKTTGGFDVVESNLRKRASSYSMALRPLLESIQESFPGVLTSQLKNNVMSYRQVEDVFSKTSIERDIGFVIPFINALEDKGLLSEAKPDKIVKEANNLKDNYLESLLQIIGNKKEMAAALDSISYSFIVDQKIELRERIKGIEFIAESHRKSLDTTLRSIPDKQISKLPDVLFDNVSEKLKAVMNTAIQQNKVAIDMNRAMAIFQNAPKIEVKLGEIKNNYELLAMNIKTIHTSIDAIPRVIKKKEEIDDSTLMNFLMTDDPKDSISKIGEVMELIKRTNRSRDQIEDDWVDLTSDLLGEIIAKHQITEGMEEISKMHKVAFFSPSYDRTKLEEINTRIRALGVNRKLLTIESQFPMDFASLAVKYVQEITVQNSLREALSAKLQSRIDDFHGRAKRSVEPYLSFIERRSPEVRKSIDSVEQIDRWAEEKRQLIKRGAYSRFGQELESEFEELVKREITVLRKKIIQVVPDNEKRLLIETIAAKESATLIKYIKTLYSNKQDFEKGIEILCELEELGLLWRVD